MKKGNSDVIDARKIIEKAKTGFEADLLTPAYRRITSDSEHLENLLDLGEMIPGRNYLDVGTGGGFVAFEWARRNPEVSVIGLDIAEQTITANTRKALENNYGNLRFMSFAGMNFPFPNAFFHGSVSRYAFHHFPLPDLAAEEIHRTLEPAGYCVISDPKAEAGDETDFVNQFAGLRNDGHVRYYREPELIRLFERAGLFVETKFSGVITFPRPLDDRYERLLARTDPKILDRYRVRVENKQVILTVQVMNIRFRKLGK